MGAAGKALPGGGKRRRSTSPPAHSKDGGFGLPPHPLAVRSGQRYFPRVGKRRRSFQVGRPDPTRGIVLGRRVDGGERVRLSIARLLAVRPDGQGAHYQFAGFDSRRYATYAVVVAVAGGEAQLVLPEWHPARPLRLPTRILPAEAQAAGSWLTCRADLSQPRPAQLSASDFSPTVDPGPGVCHRPTYRPTPPPPVAARRPAGRGCGDVVLELPAGGLEGLRRRGELLDVFVVERPEPVEAGDRVYLRENNSISRFLELERVELRPVGALLRCRPEVHTLPLVIPAGWRCEQHHWTWRWWTRAIERPGKLPPPPPDPDAIDSVYPDFPWTWRLPAIRPQCDVDH